MFDIQAMAEFMLATGCQTAYRDSGRRFYFGDEDLQLCNFGQLTTLQYKE